MPEDSTESKPRVSWSSIFFTIATGLLLAGFNYGFSLIATYIFSDRVDIYFVERPVLPESRFQKLVVVDNFSSNVINEIQFTVTAENAIISSPLNLEKFEQNPTSPRTALIKMYGVLPNRQASFVLQSDVFIPEESFRSVKAPIGLHYKSKDRLFESWFDGSQLINALIQFIIYIVGMLYFERRMATISVTGDELRERLTKRQAEIEETRLTLTKIQKENLRNKLVQVQRIMNLAKENRLWKEVSLGFLQQSVTEQNAAKKLLGIILKKAGITPVKNWSDLEDEELVEAIQDAKAQLAIGPNV